MSDYPRQIFMESGITPFCRHPQLDQVIYGHILIVLSEVQGRRAHRPCEPCKSGAGVAAARITASNTSPRALKEKRMQRLALTLLTLLLLPLPGWSTNLSLFVIQRNKN